MPQRRSTTRGFKQTAAILGGRIRKAGESRGFAVSRVLTHWDEIAGEDLARLARPVKVGYARNGFGATLTVLATGAQAPIVEMEKERLRQRVNAAYGYNAISRIRITQTAPTGFAEARSDFAGRGADRGDRDGAIDPRARRAAESAAGGITDTGLRQALERLGCHVLTKSQN